MQRIGLQMADKVAKRSMSLRSLAIRFWNWRKRCRYSPSRVKIVNTNVSAKKQAMIDGMAVVQAKEAVLQARRKANLMAQTRTAQRRPTSSRPRSSKILRSTLLIHHRAKSRPELSVSAGESSRFT
jgi:hypothetical protein